MPKQNRVTPGGELIATPERGALMGNRGLLHNARGEVKRPWRLKAWITCQLEFKNRHRPVMAPGQYTELFFLDEATALAAGHRPCAECRRADFIRFKQTWLAANPGLVASPNPRIGELDNHMHEERIRDDGGKKTYAALLYDLPDGVFVLDEPGEFFLVSGGYLWRWTPSGYISKSSLRPDFEVDVITPRSIVSTIAAGYVPEIHKTCRPK